MSKKNEWNLSPKKRAKKEKKEKVKSEAKGLWEIAGFHRPLAGMLYNYLLLLVVILPGILIISVVVPNFILPYPESIGFYNVTLAYLQFVFFFLDFGLKNATERYVAEYAETDPRHAIKYVSFYIWFQMFSGIIQITVISAFAIFIVPQTDMGYAVWFFLVYIMIQWPGTIGIYETALSGFQQFNKSNILYVIQNFAVQVLTAVSFIYIGRLYGEQNPEVGSLMGATIGFIFGMYVDDLIGLGLGLYFFKKVLEPFGITLRDTFSVSFDKQLIKQVLTFGGKVVPSGGVYFLVNFLITLMLTSWLYNYSTIIGLYFIASTLVGALSMTFPMTAPLSEAYNNRKKELALYMIRMQFVWWGLLTVGFFLLPILILFPLVLVKIGGEFGEAAWMIFPLFIPAVILFPSNFAGTICEACDFPEQSTFMNFIEQGTRFATYFFVLNPWFGIGSLLGRENIIIFWLLAEAPGYFFKGIYGWIIVKRKLFPGLKIKVPYLQMLLIPLIAIIPVVPIVLLMVVAFSFLFEISQLLALGAAVVFLIAMLYLVPTFVLMPLYGFLGGWDDHSLEDLRRAAVMSGPSRGIVMRLYKYTKYGHDHSLFKGRFKISYEQAEKEARELTLIRKQLEKKEAKLLLE